LASGVQNFYYFSFPFFSLKKIKKRGQATFFAVGVRPYHTECPKGKNAGKYLLPMARPDPSELRSRGEEQMENGVKNLKGARLFPKPFLITEMEMLTVPFFSLKA